MTDEPFRLSCYLAAVRERAAEQRRREAENEDEAAAHRDAALDACERYIRNFDPIIVSEAK